MRLEWGGIVLSFDVEEMKESYRMLHFFFGKAKHQEIRTRGLENLELVLRRILNEETK
jgi:hypothetical protein